MSKPLPEKTGSARQRLREAEATAGEGSAPVVVAGPDSGAVPYPAVDPGPDVDAAPGDGPGQDPHTDPES